MSENDLGSDAVKERLLSLYESGPPQVFTQVLVDYDAARQQISTESARVYDLRAAARLQILFADGFKKEAAIRFLKEAIRHLEDSGLPPSEAAVLYPDGRGRPQPCDAPLPPAAPAAQAAAAGWEPLLASLQTQRRRREETAPPLSPTLPPPARTREIRSQVQTQAAFPTLEGYEARSEREGARGRLRRFVPALLSTFGGI